ncbi:DNA double-strand break repair nuclease NurA [Stetteria hydrogenophila]
MASLLEAALRRRERIRRLVKLFYEREDTPKVREVRGKIRRLPPPRGDGVPVHAVEDGGSRLEKCEAYTLYAVKAWASLYSPGPGGFDLASPPVEEADVGVVVPPVYDEDRVRLYRETLEAYATARVASRAERGLILWDGSLRVIISRHRPGAPDERRMQDVERAAAERLGFGSDAAGMYGELWGRVWRAALLGAGDPPTLSLVEERLGVDKLESADGRWLPFLEWVEKVMAFRLLLEESWRRGLTPVFISKTSRSTLLAGGKLPDVYYLRLAEPVEPFWTEQEVLHGMTEIRRLEGKETRGPFFPNPGVEELNLNDFYEERLGIAEFYVRLDRDGPILKVEVAFDASRHSDDEARSMAEGVVSALLSLPRAQGYPLTLKVAHSRARLTSSELRRALHALGLDLERCGRRMLSAPGGPGAPPV